MSSWYIPLILIVSLFMLSINVIVLTNIEPVGYELSIYKPIPIFSWIILFANIIISFSITITLLLVGKYDKYKLYINVAIFLSILSIFTILSLPILRGYVIYGRGDVLTHIGYIKDIINFNHVDEGNFYPVLHILTAEIILVAGITNIFYLCERMILLFFLLFILFNYILSKKISNDHYCVYFLVLFNTILLDSSNTFTMFFPAGFTIMMFPLYLYLYYFDKSLKRDIILYIMISLLVFSHILSALLIVLILISMEISKFIYCKIKCLDSRSYLSKGFIIFTFVVLISWIWNFYLWNKNILLLYSYIYENIKYIAIYKVYGFSKIINIKDLFIKMYLDDLIFLILYMLSLILLKDTGIFILNRGVSILFFLIIFNLFVVNLPGLGFGPFRILPFLEVVLRLSGALFIYSFIKKLKTNTNKVLKILMCSLIIALITAAVIIGVFSLYWSPFTYRANHQVSSTDIYGAKWLAKNEGPINLNYIGQSFRLLDAIIGAQARTTYYILQKSPDHLKYSEANTKTYLIITDFDKKAYTTVWHGLEKINKYDFENIYINKYINKLYTNNWFEIWCTNS